MATLTIRNLDDAVKQRLRVRAARRGIPMEEEARVIIRDALASDGDPLVPESGVPAEKDGKQWHLDACLEEILAPGRKPENDFDLKAVSDALYDYLDGE